MKQQLKRGEAKPNFADKWMAVCFLTSLSLLAITVAFKWPYAPIFLGAWLIFYPLGGFCWLIYRARQRKEPLVKIWSGLFVLMATALLFIGILAWIAFTIKSETQTPSTPAQQSIAPRRLPAFATLRPPGAGEFSVVSLRLLQCLKQAVLWPLTLGRVKSKLAASGLSRGAACSLWCGVWVSESETNITATQPGAAPDRPQCCRFSGFVARLKLGRGWRAAGELSVLSLRAALLELLQ